MKGFIKTVFASALGFFVALIIVSILSVGIFAGMVASVSSSGFQLKEKSFLHLKLEGLLKERTSSNPLMELLGLYNNDMPELGLDDILSAIKKAKENENIKGIYIDSKAFSASSASLQAIRDALVDFKTSKKFIVAYADYYTQGAYYISTVADKLVLNPQGGLDLHGLSVSPTYYKGLLDKLGVEMQVFKVGAYKSAVEPFTSSKMSDPNREQLLGFINDIWGNIAADIAKSRKITVQQVNLAADKLPLLQSQDSIVSSKLVDALMYETDVKNYLRKLTGLEKKDQLRAATITDLKDVELKSSLTKSMDKIAILYAEGEITSGSSTSDEGITNEKYVKEIEKLKDDENVKAVVFRVNSPGGSAYASEQIWKAITDLKAVKPVVVSMGDYAASGGYYISCNASKIVAEPTSLTGSIGIFGMFPNVEGLTQKLGLSFDNVKTNKLSDFGDITRPMREEEKVILQAYINRGYELFTKRCADGRKIPIAKLKEIAQGHIWSGTQALKLGLIDKLGGLDVAVKEAAVLAKTKDYSTAEYPEKSDFLTNLLSDKKEQLKVNLVKEYLGDDYQMVSLMKKVKNQDYIQARLPYIISVR
ncbi:MAG: signal peptide peptidase SppA [Bacteroidales bacterium 45-6]|nr:MAG: signal peptide peptidase SppA [Bacteroidales bacterium 45-6]